MQRRVTHALMLSAVLFTLSHPVSGCSIAPTFPRMLPPFPPTGLLIKAIGDPEFLIGTVVGTVNVPSSSVCKCGLGVTPLPIGLTGLMVLGAELDIITQDLTSPAGYNLTKVAAFPFTADASVSSQLQANPKALAGSVWQGFSANVPGFTPDPSKNYALFFDVKWVSGNFPQTDNIQFATGSDAIPGHAIDFFQAIPEPSTIGLFLVGMAGVVGLKLSRSRGTSVRKSFHPALVASAVFVGRLPVSNWLWFCSDLLCPGERGRWRAFSVRNE